MLLAGDIGGTKTLLGLFEPEGARPRSIAVRAFGSLEYGDLLQMIDEFMRAAGVDRTRIEAACFGVAGPVLGDAAKPTNVPWTVEAGAVRTALALRRVSLLNDLEAMGC